MTWTPEVTTVNQHVQIGAESTGALGTDVAATKELLCYDVTFQPEGDTVFYRGSGRKYDAEQEQNTEWLAATWNGNLDYNGIIYPLVSAGGSVAAATHGTSATAKDWIITPPVTGSIVPQTYSVQQGDSTYAKKADYTLFTDIGYTIERKATSFTGKTMSQSIQTGITLTASPTIVALAPIPGKHVNVYADTTSANLGVTQLLKILKVQLAWNGIYGQFFPLNRANASYTAHVDLAPQATLKMLLEADATAMAFIASWELGTTYFVRVNATGAIIDNSWTVSLGSPSAGNFTLTYNAQTTTNIAYNATAATVQTALAALSSVPTGTVAVSGSAGGPYTVTFSGSIGTSTNALTGSGAGLTGGTFAVTSAVVNNVFQHDMAIKFDKPDAFSDSNGVYAIGLNGRIVEDPTWAKSQLFTCTNLITAL